MFSNEVYVHAPPQVEVSSARTEERLRVARGVYDDFLLGNDVSTFILYHFISKDGQKDATPTALTVKEIEKICARPSYNVDIKAVSILDLVPFHSILTEFWLHFDCILAPHISNHQSKLDFRDGKLSQNDDWSMLPMIIA